LVIIIFLTLSDRVYNEFMSTADIFQ